MAKYLRLLLMSAVLAFIFWFSYLNQTTYHYLVPPGGDAYGHLRIVNRLLSGDWSALWQYHTVWHVIVATVSRATGTHPITVMAWLGPGLLVTASASLFLVGWRLVGYWAGLVSALLIGLFSFQPLQTLWDGGFPNVLAAGTVAPIFFLALISASQTKRRLALHWFVAGLVFILLLFSHHLTTLQLLPSLAVYLIVESIFWLRRKPYPWLVCLLAPAVMAGIILLIAESVFNSATPNSLTGLASTFLHVDWQWPFFHFIGQLDNPNALIPTEGLPNLIGNGLFWFGIAGLLPLLYCALLQPNTTQGRWGRLTVIWFLTLFIGSQQEELGFPVRLARDLAIPLAISGGFLVQCFAQWQPLKSRFIGLVTACGLIIYATVLGWPVYQERLTRFQSPNELIYHLSADEQMVDYIKQNIPKRTAITMYYDDIYLATFLPDHAVIVRSDSDYSKAAEQPTQMLSRVFKGDYLYVERRLDRPDGLANNDGMIDRYLKSKDYRLAAKYLGEEKSVYLFQSLNGSPRPVGQ